MSNFVVRPLAGTLLGYPQAVSTATSYKVLISGTQVFNIAGNLKIDLSIGRRSQASFLIRTNTQTHFQQYQRITVFDQDSLLIFSGYISQIQEQQIGFHPSIIHTISAIDQHFLADKRIVAAIYQDKTCGAIVVDIQKKILAQEGVTIGVVYDGLLPSSTLYPSPTLYPNGNIGAISSITFAYCTVADALDQLVTLASSAGIPYYWMIDQTKKLYFVPYTYLVNTTIVDGTMIDQVNNPCTVQRANPKYRNREWLTGGVSQTPLQTQSFIGDNNATSWTLNYQVASAPIVLLSTQGGGQNLSQIVGVKGTTGSEYYWAQGDAVISQDNGLPKLQSTQTLTIIYTGQFPSVINTQNNAQIATQAKLDGTSGIIEVVDDDKNLTDANSAILEASQLLSRYSVSGTLCQFTTLSPSYRPGQLITVNLPNHALNNAQMLVESVSIIDNVDNYNVWYQVNAVQGPYDNTWVAFFSNLLKGSHPATNVTVGSASTPPTAPTLLLMDASIRFRLQTSGGHVATQVFKDASMRFKFAPQNVTSVTTQLKGTLALKGTVTVTTATSGTGGGSGNYPTFSGPTSACTYSPAIVPYQTNSKQAIRFFKFSDDTNGTSLLTNPYIVGMNVLLYWSQMEPSEGSYQWSVLDSIMAPWAAAGKTLIVRIATCGQKKWAPPYSVQGTPQWVFDAGVPHYTNDGGDVVPAYWNGVYLSKFKAFVNAFGQRYNGNAGIEFVQTAVGMGGECKPDTHKATDTYSKLQSIGYTDQIWLDTCKTVIDYYKAAFPTTKRGLQSAAGFYTSGFSESQIVAYAISQGSGLQNDGIGLGLPGANNYIPPKSTWTNAPFISTEQRSETSVSGDPFECDIQAMISYCQQSEPIYLLCFLNDLMASGNQSILAKYATTN